MKADHDDAHLDQLATRLRNAASADDVRAILTEIPEDPKVPDLAALRALFERVALDSAKSRTDLRAAIRARETLLASVAHDLRNPLNTFAMSAGLLRDDLEGADFDRTRGLGLLSRMDRAATRMQILIEDLLEASRIEAGAIEIARRDEATMDIVDGALAKAKPLVLDKGAKLEKDNIAEADAMLRVGLDRARTIEALVRLVAVALKSTGEGGIIRIGVERGGNNTNDNDNDHAGAAAVHFTVRSEHPHSSSSSSPTVDESRGGLALLIARGLLHAQHASLVFEATRIVARFRASE